MYCSRIRMVYAVLAVMAFCVQIVCGNATMHVVTFRGTVEDSLCCGEQSNECQFSCYNKTMQGIENCTFGVRCLNTSLYCYKSVGVNFTCDCFSSYSAKSPGRCYTKTINGLRYNETPGNSVSYSVQKCSNTDLPKAVARCEFDSTCGVGRHRFTKSNIQTFDCANKIVSVTEHVLNSNFSAFNISYISSSLLKFVQSTSVLTKNDTSHLVAFIAFVKIKAKTENLQVGAKTFTDLVLIANKLSETWLNATRGGHPSVTEQDVAEQQEVAYSLSALAQRFSLNNATYRLNATSFDLQVSDNVDLDNAITFESTSTSSKSPVRVIVPASALQRAASQTASQQRPTRSWQSVRSSFIYYRDNVLFYSNREEVNSVVSVDLGVDLELNNLAEPVRIQNLDQLMAYNKTPVTENALMSLRTRSRCVYWDQILREWSSEGCCLHVTDQTAPECRCYHLTNFAVIVKSDVVASDVVLSLVSDIGCILSMVGLLLTIIVHLIDREIRQRRPVKIVIHICSNLLISYLVFVVAIGRSENLYGCLVATAILHYFFLTSWCWMTVYSFDMYKSLVKVFDERPRHFLQLCCAYAYCVPLFIVGTTAGVAVGYFDQQGTSDLCSPVLDRLSESHYRAPNMCWLHEYSLYLGFLAPVGAMLFYNILVFCRVTHELSCNTSQARSRELQRTVKQNLIIAVTMTSMLGLTWASGYLVLISDNPSYETVTSWVFALLCTLQGFAIFILTSVRRSDMRNVWLSPLRTMARRTSVITASGIFRSANRKQSTSSAMISAHGGGGGGGVGRLANGKQR